MIRMKLIIQILLLILPIVFCLTCSEQTIQKSRLNNHQKEILAEFSDVINDPSILVNWESEFRVKLCNSLFKESYVIGHSNGKDLITILITALNAPERSVYYPASYILRFITIKNFGFNAFESNLNRNEAAVQWQQWWVENNNSINLDIPILENSTLIIDEIPGRIHGNDSEPPGHIFHLDARGDTLWNTKKYLMPYDAVRMKDGSYLTNIIRERAAWQILPNEKVDRKQKVGGYPCSLQLLENGNILVAGWDDNFPGFVREYNEDGKIVWQLENLRWPWKAERLSNGNTLIADAGKNRVYEVDPGGKEIWAVDNLGPEKPELFDALGPVYCQRLDDGNTLISIRGLSKIVEVDPKGKVVWEVGSELVLNQYSAVRLWNGNTLICDGGHFRVIEIDVDKNITWETGGIGYPAKAYRY